MAKDRSDFVMVRMTARGQELAGKNPLTVSNGRRSYTFTGDTPQEAEKSYDWSLFLRVHTDHAGQPLFELVPDAAASPVSKPAAAAQAPGTSAGQTPATAATTTVAATTATTTK